MDDDLAARLVTTAWLEVTAHAPDPLRPWASQPSRAWRASAFIIDGHRLLTAAHAVTHQTSIQAENAVGVRSTARIEQVSHDCDLALVSVDDPRFFDGTGPVDFGPLPPAGATIEAFGLASDGPDRVVVAGKATDVSLQMCRNSRRSVLVVRTTMILRPGSSGCPVLWDGKAIGMTVQAESDSDLAMCISSPVIQHFLAEVQTGRIGGIPDLGIYVQKIANADLASFLGTSTGVLISRVVDGSCAEGQLLPGDVLLSVDGVEIDSDGTGALDGHRIELDYFAQRRFVGDAITIALIRDRRPLSVELTLAPFASLIKLASPAMPPTFVMLAGLVFMALSHDYLLDPTKHAEHLRYKAYFHDRLPRIRRKELVIISHVLPHPANAGYEDMAGVVIETMNGRPILEVADLVAAMAQPVRGFHVIELSSEYHLDHGRLLVLDAATAARATSDVMRDHGFASDRSRDLAERR